MKGLEGQRVFRHGSCGHHSYWVEIWQRDDAHAHVQRVAVRGIGEFKKPLGDRSGQIDSIEDVMLLVQGFVDQCLPSEASRVRAELKQVERAAKRRRL